MARLNWEAPSKRFYNNGVDRGVLYVGSDTGVAWQGLVAVRESPTGGEAKPAYIDGVKFRNISSAEEFAATIEAFSAPKEFDPCDGIKSIQNGLMVTQQRRRPFNFSYRTNIGNAAGEDDSDHQIHIVYNALAGPSEREHSTLGSSSEAKSMSWDLTTLPPSMPGVRPTSHLTIDSRYTPPNLWAYLEGVLYGTEEFDPELPTATELFELFENPGPLG